MNKFIAVAIMMMTLPSSGAVHADALKVDDPSPKLKVKKWVVGEPVEIAKAGPADVFVVTFWQCSQRFSRYYTTHLSDVQRRFKDRRVRVIAVTADDEETVRNFLDSGWRRQVQFAIATDLDGRTVRRWKSPPDFNPLYTTYVVKGGRIAWIGANLENLDAQVAAACGDHAFVKAAKDFDADMTRFRSAYKDEKWDDALAALEKVLAAKPRDTRMHNSKYIILASRKKDAKAAEAAARAILDACDDAYALNDFAWGMLTEDYWRDCRDLKFATAVAEKTLALTDHRNAAIVDTYARALWETGDLAGAHQWQKKAVKLCDTDQSSAEYRQQIRETLQTYEVRINRGI